MTPQKTYYFGHIGPRTAANLSPFELCHVHNATDTGNLRSIHSKLSDGINEPVAAVAVRATGSLLGRPREAGQREFVSGVSRGLSCVHHSAIPKRLRRKSTDVSKQVGTELSDLFSGQLRKSFGPRTQMRTLRQLRNAIRERRDGISQEK